MVMETAPCQFSVPDTVQGLSSLVDEASHLLCESSFLLIGRSAHVSRSCLHLLVLSTDMVAHTCNPSPGEAEAGGSP